MASRGTLVGAVLVHGGLALAIGGIDARRSHAATAIELAEVARKKAAEKPPEPPPPPAERPKRALNRKPAAAPIAEPLPEPVAKPALDTLPDFGVSLAGGVEGGGGALPSAATKVAAAQLPTQAREPVVKRVMKAATPEPTSDCDEPAAKPKPKSVPQPAYTPQALEAGIEGKVRIQFTVDETGRVVDVRLLSGLGYGLDEAALAAARQATFEAAVRCGKPVSATFTVSMRFTKP
ncbi:MAG TPA: TonB family protein [Polyangiaceae bacterium]|nr:TonB family protein [Polyangiaceae bacterium]